MSDNTRGRPTNEQIAGYVADILKMRVGTSVFVPNAKTDQLEFLRKPVKRAGAVIEIVQVTHDEIYQSAGVRLFRREGSYDQL